MNRCTRILAAAPLIALTACATQSDAGCSLIQNLSDKIEIIEQTEGSFRLTTLNGDVVVLDQPAVENEALCGHVLGSIGDYEDQACVPLETIVTFGTFERKVTVVDGFNQAALMNDHSLRYFTDCTPYHRLRGDIE